MENDIFRTVLRDHEELASLPQSLAEVLRLSRNPESSARDLSAVLMRDPGLTVRVLRLANSPMFGDERPIRSVTQAVMTLGIRAVTALALSASVYDLAGTNGSSVDRVRFWRHSLAVATGARGIAEAIHYECPDEAFVAGLLHDIGLLVLEKSFPDRFARLWRQAEAGENVHELEEKVWGTNHARVGQFLLDQWRLPETICAAVGRHHAECPSGDGDSRLSEIVALANAIAPFTVVRARSPHTSTPNYCETFTRTLDIDRERMQCLRAELLDQTIREATFLDVNIDSTEALVIEANRMLYQQFIALEQAFREIRAAQREVSRAQLEKSALESLKVITATFNHYINNAVGTILGRAQLVEHDISRGVLADPRGSTRQSMETIIRGVKTIRAVMDELTDLTAFKTTVYYDDTYIVDVEKKIRQKVEAIAGSDVPAAR